MEKRRLGRTDIEVTSICLGTMTWGQQNTEAEGFQQMDYAVDRGINFFDTAELYSIPPKAETYGATEEIVGNWFKARGGRDKIVLASKVAGRSDNTYMRADGRPPVLSRTDIVEAVDNSLKRLQTDYIDLYQVHWPDRPTPLFGRNGTVYKHVKGDSIAIEETLEALDGIVRAGKVRHIGVSNESPWGVMRYLASSEFNDHARIQSIQNAYNLVNRTFELGLAEIAHEEDVGLLAYSPLAQGYLTGKYEDGAQPEGARRTLFGRTQARYEKPGAETARKAYFELADDFGLDRAQLAIAFVLNRSFVTSAIIGATTMEQLKTDIDAADMTWSDELEDAINAVHQLHQNPSP
ncbi:MAG: aldo/keto reductase [Rhodobiaceae bacterium]|nr:aldo/keto reductase [Rhodobiaceae bacterium]